MMGVRLCRTAWWFLGDLGKLYSSWILKFNFPFQKGKTHLRLSRFSDFEIKPLYRTIIALLIHVEAQARWSKLELYVYRFHFSSYWYVNYYVREKVQHQYGNIFVKIFASPSNFPLQSRLFLEILIKFSCGPENTHVLKEFHAGKLWVFLKSFTVPALCAESCWGQILLLLDYQVLYLSFSEEEEEAYCLCDPFAFLGLWQAADLLFLASTTSP